MVSVQIEYKNGDKIQKQLNRTSGSLRKMIVKALKAMARQVKKTTKPFVPVRTGKSRKSIKTSVSRSKLTAYIGSNWYVMRFIEGGTKNMYARRPIERGVRAEEKYIRETINAAILDAIEEGARA